MIDNLKRDICHQITKSYVLNFSYFELDIFVTIFLLFSDPIPGFSLSVTIPKIDEVTFDG